MTERDPIVIVGSARTPMGGFQGDFAGVPAATLGATAIEAALSRAELAKDAVQEILMGCVLSAGQGQAPARQAAIAAGLPLSAGATTLNKMCGSGMKAVMLAHDLVHTRALRMSSLPAAWRACRMHLISCRRRAPVIAWDMDRFSTTCFSTAWRMPMRKVV